MPSRIQVVLNAIADELAFSLERRGIFDFQPVAENGVIRNRGQVRSMTDRLRASTVIAGWGMARLNEMLFTGDQGRRQESNHTVKPCLVGGRRDYQRLLNRPGNVHTR